MRDGWIRRLQIRRACGYAGGEVGTMYEDGCEDTMAAIRALWKAATDAGRVDEFGLALKDKQEFHRLCEEFGIEVEA